MKMEERHLLKEHIILPVEGRGAGGTAFVKKLSAKQSNQTT
jgi:hypothetical protein